MKLRANFLLLIVIIWVWATCLSAQFRAGSGTENDPYLISSQTELNNIRHFSDAYFLQTGDIHLENDWHPIELFSGFYDGNGYTIYNLNIKTNQDNTGLFSVLSGGQISSLRLEGGSVTGRDNVGALVGSNEGGTIYRCSANLTVSGRNDVGGLIGSNFGVIEESFSHSSSITGNKNTGGLVGANYGEQIINCYSTNSVSGITSTGGLTGLNIIEGKVRNSYATGKVSGETDTGGFAGRNLYADIQNSYWDIWTSGQTESAGAVDPPQNNYYGLTTHQMLNKYNFDNWDFAYGPINSPNDVWRNWSTTNLNPYILKSYPYLSWQNVPGEHNFPYPDTTHVKFFSEERLDHWDSFPRLRSDTLAFSYTAALLDTLTICPDTGIEKVYQADDDYMEYRYDLNPPAWSTQDILLIRWKGYVLEFIDPEPPHEQRDWYLQVSGERLAAETPISLEPNQEYWVGYFLPETQPLWDAFASSRNYLSYIIGQDGGYYWCPQTEQWQGIYPGPNAYYGKMYKMGLRQGVAEFNFTWDIARGGSEFEGKDIFYRPKPEYFSFKDGYKYEELFIEYIEDDRYVEEIGVFAGDECIGATVLNGEYPVSILAYTNETHRGSEISFVLYKGERREPERISMVYARCNRTGAYTLQTLRPLQQMYTLIRIGEGGTRGDIVKPQIVMGQNYPNPFVARVGAKTRSVRTRSSAPASSPVITRIPLYLPEKMDVSLTVFNIKGQKVKEIVSGYYPAGEHRLEWDGTNKYNQNVSSGIYFYRLETSDKTITRKMLIVR